MKQNISPEMYVQILGNINEISQSNQKYYFQEGKVVKKAKTKDSYLILFEDGNKKWFNEKFLHKPPFKFIKTIDEKNDIKLTLELCKTRNENYHIIINAWCPTDIYYRRWDSEKYSSDEWKQLLKEIKENIFDNIHSYDKDVFAHYEMIKY